MNFSKQFAVKYIKRHWWFRSFALSSCRMINMNPESTSVDLTDIENLSKKSKDWWNTSGPMKALHSFNYLRVPFIRDGLISTKKVNKLNVNSTKVLTNIDILEVGCGGGILTEVRIKSLAKLNANTIGIDPSKDLLEIAKDHAKKNAEISSRITYICDTIENHAIKNLNKYDAVILSEVIEHVINPQFFLEKCVETLKPGGSIFLTTFNKTPLSYFYGIILAEYVFNAIPKNTHQYEKFIGPFDVQRILETNNCSVVLTNGLFYEIWANSWRWIDSTAISYALHAIKNTTPALQN